MKKLIGVLLAVSILLSLAACGGKSSEQGKIEWTRQGTFIDAEGNCLLVSASDEEGFEGWNVSFMPEGNMVGGVIPQEGNTLHGDLCAWDENADPFIVTVSEEGEEGLKMEVEGGDVYHFTPVAVPEYALTVSINTYGLGQIAYVAEGEELQFDDEYPKQSAFVNLEEPATYVIGAKADEGWTFVHWTKNGEDYLTDEVITEELTENTDYVAVFEFVRGPEETAVFSYVHDPRENPGAMADIIENPDAVYGFSPDPESERLGAYAEYDWTDPELVARAQEERRAYHESMDSMTDILYRMREEGATIEEMARAVSEERNRLRLAAYQDDPEGLASARESNLKTYGHEEGPTPDELYEKYGSWTAVLQKAFSPNMGMDACCGLYDEYYWLYVELGYVE